ncbi:MAG: hypothetical protein AMJ75_07595 [Phycisphaerae bacterium SM1_79]|nr:MAG: hypothetical protein AMJ75_07595 [Phycisphaerae bacterium SM1_79]
MVLAFIVVCVVVFIYVGVPFTHARLGRLMLKHRAIKSNAIVLTFDDGPSCKLTPALLSVLAESKAKATFFLLGRNVAGREEIVRQIAAQGHEVCSHGYDHIHHWKVSPFRALSDIRRGWQAIDAALGRKQLKYPFRPPNGKLNIVCLAYLLFRRVPIVYWSTDSGDTWQSKPDSHRIALLAKKAGGIVSLVHDFDRADDKVSRFVLESVRLALATAKDKGMRVLTVSELFDGSK